MMGKVQFNQRLVGQTWLVRIEFNEIQEFVAGQYASLKVDAQGVRRSYSIASLPGEKYVDLLVDVTPMGIGSKYILSLQPGDEVELLAYLGRFVVEDEILSGNDRVVIFVATGTGVAPMKPMIENLLRDKKFEGQVKLYWGMRHEEDVYWIEEMERIEKDHENFKFNLVLSQPKDDWLGMKGHVGEVIDKETLSWNTTVFYLCGRSEMVTEVAELVKMKGVSDEKVIYERFS